MDKHYQPARLITVDEATALVAARLKPLQMVNIALGEALGHVLAADVMSDVDSPPHDKSMMDGFAVCAGDDSPQRIIIEEVMAGDVPTKTLQPGQATRVMTGAPVPAGTSAVVPVEQTTLLNPQTVQLVGGELPAGKHIMPRGKSMRVGQCVLQAGSVVREIEIAIAAEVGAAELSVVAQPRVAILATGNELVDANEKPAAGQIRNSNGPMLAAAATAAGAKAIELPVGRDDLEELQSRVTEGLAAADVLLVSGGVSAGVKDLAPQVLESAGVEQVFHKIALKPGKPLWFGIASGGAGGGAPSSTEPGAPPKLVFGLPGNPVSGLVCFHLFVKPALAVLAGRATGFARPWIDVTLAAPLEHRGGRETFRPARLIEATTGTTPRVELFDWQGSADLAGLATANCLLHLPTAPCTLAAGDSVRVVPLRHS